MLRKLASPLVFFLAFQCVAAAQATRHFTFHYAFTVKDVPSGQHVKIWFPSAQSNDYQHVRVLSAKGDLPLKRTHEPRFGNEIYFAEASKAKGGDLHFEVVYDVVRYEHLTLGLIRPRLQNAVLDKKDNQLYLRRRQTGSYHRATCGSRGCKSLPERTPSWQKPELSTITSSPT